MTDAMISGEAFARGEPRAVEAVREAVEGVVRRFRLPAPAGNDLAQEVLTRLLDNVSAGRFRGESSFTTYACRVARYTCLEHLRRRRDERPLDSESLTSQARWSRTEESFLWTEEHLRNLEIFSALPEDCRELLRWIFVDGLSYREIGRRLGVSEGAVKVRVFRCRLAFRQASGLSPRRPARREPEKRKP